MRNFPARLTLLLIGSSLAAPATVRADELILTRAQALAQGYRPVANPKKSQRFLPNLAPHSLNWPVAFADVNHTMGNTMIQFQQYSPDESYFHGGCDLRTQKGAEIHAPVAGNLNAGHYSYVTHSDGSMEKLIKPWPQTGQSAYFEVNITSDDGYRFEFHHVDRSTLPASIVALLNNGGGRIEAGTLIGKVIEWSVRGVDGQPYHHTHYNVFDPSGVHLNPENLSRALDDSTPPTIHGVWGIDSLGNVLDPLLAWGPSLREYIVAATDQRSPNVYTHTPPFVSLRFENGKSTVWDFREKLTAADGVSWPAIWNVFRPELVTPDGEHLRTQGDYNSNFFLFRLAVPAGSDGSVEIEVRDQNGNSTTWNNR